MIAHDREVHGEWQRAGPIFKTWGFSNSNEQAHKEVADEHPSTANPGG
jgi:hypothetical protein